MKQQTLFDRFTKDKDGDWALFHPPNWPIILWALFKVLSYPSALSEFKSGFEFLSTSFLFVWAYLEVTSGVNYTRRLLGLTVLTMLIVYHF